MTSDEEISMANDSPLQPKDPTSAQLVERSAKLLLSIGPQLPSYAATTELIESLQPAIERGYFRPDEDEALRMLFTQYLRIRASLLATLRELRPLAIAETKAPSSQRSDFFLIAFCIATMLMRSGKFLVDNFRKQPVVWRKLDEAEPRFNLPSKQFTKIYRSVTSPRNIWTYLAGVQHFQDHYDQIMSPRDDEQLNNVVALLKEEEPFMETSKRYFATAGLKYRWHSFLRRNHSGFKKFTFGLFQLSGSVIAELRMHWKRKRVTPKVKQRIFSLLQPGDVIITRHDDAASNLFLPGFWPHGALYLGTDEQREQLAIEAAFETQRLATCRAPHTVLEAKKDGVLFRELQETLSVDACVVLRPNVSAAELAEALARGMTHQGKGYDFEFDFRRSDKLVCTEVVYRAYHGIGAMRFELTSRAGRVCLSAEDILDYAIDHGLFEVILVYGAKRNRFVTGENAAAELIASYRQGE